MPSVSEMSDHHRKHCRQGRLRHLWRNPRLLGHAFDQACPSQPLLHLLRGCRGLLTSRPALNMILHPVLLETVQNSAQTTRMLVQRLQQPARHLRLGSRFRTRLTGHSLKRIQKSHWYSSLCTMPHSALEPCNYSGDQVYNGRSVRRVARYRKRKANWKRWPVHPVHLPGSLPTCRSATEQRQPTSDPICGSRDNRRQYRQPGPGNPRWSRAGLQTFSTVAASLRSGRLRQSGGG